ncbi:MAG TPA: HdeA/HdeB family chaperone [Xanthobacteraceae bacterium]
MKTSSEKTSPRKTPHLRTFAAMWLGCGLIGGSIPAHAATIDFSKITCKQFFDTHKGDANLLLAWLNGFYRESDDPPVLDIDEFNADAKKLTAYCAAHPNDTLTAAADEIFAE